MEEARTHPRAFYCKYLSELNDKNLESPNQKFGFFFGNICGLKILFLSLYRNCKGKSKKLFFEKNKKKFQKYLQVKNFVLTFVSQFGNVFGKPIQSTFNGKQTHSDEL